MMFFNINTTLLILLTLIFLSNAVETNNRRILHQPLSTESALSPPPPPAPTAPPKGTGYGRDEPFFPEVPFGGASPNPNQTPPSTPTPTPPTTTKGSGDQGRIPPEPQPAKPAKRVAVAVSVGIVTLGMLSALAFYLYRHRGKNTVDSTDKFVADGNSRRYAADDEARPRGPPSEFLYIGTVEPASDDNDPAERSRYQKLSNSFKGTSGRYRPSPDLQPLPPLINAPATRSLRDVNHNSVSPTATASSDGDETRDAVFYTPNGSVEGSVDDGFWTPDMNFISGSRTNSMNTIYRGDDHSGRHFPRSTKSRVLDFTPDVVKHAIIPFIKTAPLPPPPPPPPLRSPPRPRQPVEQAETETETETSDVKECHSMENREMPPTNLAISPSHDKSKTPPATPPPPPPPPPPPRVSPRPPPPPPPRPPSSTPRRVGIEVANGPTAESPVSQDTQFQTPNSTTECSRRNTVANINEDDNECSSSGRPNGDDMGDRRPKLKPLHWDKVRATSDKATVWDQLKSSSFQLNEDMMESLFGCNLSAGGKKEPTKKALVSAAEKQHRVLDPKKSQNIAILLRALNVTKDEVTDALLDGNSEGLGADLFETLVKMAPTKEEEIKLKDYSGDVSKLGAAERFLKGILDVPFAFRRVEAMLYSTNFDAEVKYLTKSFDTLEVASEELKNSRLFLKLLEAVLQTGNRMNVGTNRGDAKAFKLDTLLKLVDIKGTDGKTTLLHFVVQEIIKSEGIDSQAPPNQSSSKKKEDEFRKHGLQIVSGLSRELGSVQGAAGMDSDVLSNYVSKLEIGLQKIRQVLQLEKPDTQGKFFESMKTFLKDAEDQITRVKAHERRALSHVREVTEYFHGDTAKEEAHPLRIFLIVRDFLSVLDNVCKEVGRMDERTVMGTSTSFRISAYASLPAPDKRNIRHDDSSGDLGMSNMSS